MDSLPILSLLAISTLQEFNKVKVPNILLVEDEILIAMTIEQELNNLGYSSVHHFTSGKKAIDYCRNHNPDIVLMDIRLSKNMDGLEAAEKIKAILPVPIVFMTGYSTEEIRKKADALNPLAFFEKPIVVKELVSVINSHFQNDLKCT